MPILRNLVPGALLLLGSVTTMTQAFYLPGVNPKNYKVGEE